MAMKYNLIFNTSINIQKSPTVTREWRESLSFILGIFGVKTIFNNDDDHHDDDVDADDAVVTQTWAGELTTAKL